MKFGDFKLINSFITQAFFVTLTQSESKKNTLNLKCTPILQFQI